MPVRTPPAASRRPWSSYCSKIWRYDTLNLNWLLLGPSVVSLGTELLYLNRSNNRFMLSIDLWFTTGFLTAALDLEADVWSLQDYSPSEHLGLSIELIKSMFSLIFWASVWKAEFFPLQKRHASAGGVHIVSFCSSFPVTLSPQSSSVKMTSH